jgi:hypothetical protein
MYVKRVSDNTEPSIFNWSYTSVILGIEQQKGAHQVAQKSIKYISYFLPLDAYTS